MKPIGPPGLSRPRDAVYRPMQTERGGRTILAADVAFGTSMRRIDASIGFRSPDLRALLIRAGITVGVFGHAARVNPRSAWRVVIGPSQG